MLRYKVKKFEVKERVPPDRDYNYQIVAEYFPGDGRQPIVPLALKFLKERKIYDIFIILYIFSNLILISILLLNIVAIYSLTSAQTATSKLLQDNFSHFVTAKVIYDVGKVKIIELTFSTKNKILDFFIWVKKAYVTIYV